MWPTAILSERPAAFYIRRFRLVSAVLMSLAMSACATTPEPRIVTQEVKVPVPVPCKPNLGPEPAYADTEEALKAAPGLYERVQLLLAGRLQRIARDREKDAALKACAAP
jgi:hypothetical protein